MEEKKRLPEAELAVMRAIWTHDGEVARSDIESALSAHHWTANTINTYLTRLCAGRGAATAIPRWSTGKPT